MPNKIEVFSTSNKFVKMEKEAQKIFIKALSLMKKKNIKFSVFLVTEKEIKKLNKLFRKKDKSTNVLSFENPPNFIFPDRRLKDVGEIYISPDFIRKNNQSLAQMAVHGTLHLFGFDHKNKPDSQKMERKEKWLLKRV